jgi:hypothetical protein
VGTLEIDRGCALRHNADPLYPKDNYGLMHFRNLDEVERRLNVKAKQS